MILVGLSCDKGNHGNSEVHSRGVRCGFGAKRYCGGEAGGARLTKTGGGEWHGECRPPPPRGTLIYEISPKSDNFFLENLMPFRKC